MQRLPARWGLRRRPGRRPRCVRMRSTTCASTIAVMVLACRQAVGHERLPMAGRVGSPPCQEADFRRNATQRPRAGSGDDAVLTLPAICRPSRSRAERRTARSHSMSRFARVSSDTGSVKPSGLCFLRHFQSARCFGEAASVLAAKLVSRDPEAAQLVVESLLWKSQRLCRRSHLAVVPAQLVGDHRALEVFDFFRQAGGHLVVA